MRDSLLDLVCCPLCQAPLRVEATEWRDGQAWAGQVVGRCGHRYPIQDGMPRLYVEDESWAVKSAEARGWVQYHQQLGIYEPVPDAVDLQIPYHSAEPWPGIARSFDIALETLQLTGQETILDLGAGRGWAAKQFALHGCRVVALDIIPDLNIGLGRAYALMGSAGVQFDLVIGDGERLPFKPGVFDVVFCSATLHHASDLTLLLRNIAYVLKSDGRLCAIYEPCISLLEDEKAILIKDAAEELSLGIHETRPDFNQYMTALAGAGLVVECAFSPQTYTLPDTDLLAIAHGEGVMWDSRWARLHQHYPYIKRFVAKRWAIWRQGQWSEIGRFRSADARTQAQFSLLQWTTGELCLVARKPDSS